jgi:hypothetical protein
VKNASTTKAEAEIQVVKGSFYSDSSIEMLGPSGRMDATLALPQGVDMLMKGDTVKVTLVTRGAFPLADALVAAKGAFADYAAALKAAGAAAPAPPVPPAAAPVRAATPPACPYTAAELSAALGIDVNEGAAAAPMPFVGGTMLSCQYRAKRPGAPWLSFNQTVMDDPAQARPDEYFKRMAGTMQPVPNDPDKAMWQGDQGDLTNATLHYARNGVLVQARVSIGPKDPLFQTMRERLARLRRVP